MFTRCRILSFAMLAAVLAGAAQAQPVRVLGRSEPIKPAGFEVQWPMSGFEARFTGKTLTAVIEDGGSNWFEVMVDGKSKPVELKQGKHTYTLFSGAEGSHTIKVTRRTGAPQGSTRIISIKADGLAPTLSAERRILVIGDSIAAGYGVEGEDQRCSYTPATQNAGIAYPALLGRAFGADVQVVAADGRGLYRNYGGEDATMETAMWRTLPDRAKAWTSAEKPQLIVVNLGVNDFANGDPGAGFDTAYVKLLQNLRQTWPDAPIIAAFGAMLDGANYSAAKASVEGSVEKARGAGVKKVEFVELSPPAVGKRFGCNWHPGADAQRHMAQTLQAAITRSLAWKPVNAVQP